MILFRFFILNFFNVSLKLSSTDRHVLETDLFMFLDRLSEISQLLRIAVVFKRLSSTPEKRVKGCVGSGIELLMSKHPLTLQNILIKIITLLANRSVPKKFKRNPFLPMPRSVMFLL